MPARVLFVAHDKEVQRSGTTILRGEGWDVLHVADADNGLRRWASDRPDLVVVDAVLEGTDGFTFVERLRSSESGAHVPIVLLGPDSDIEAKIRAFRAGADDFVARTLNQAELVARARGLLARVVPPDATAAPAQHRGEVLAWYGAKGGVGTTTLAINTALALRRESKQSVVLVDAVLQLGDHRVFLDMGPDKPSLVDACTGPTVDHEILRNSLVRHDSGVDFLLAPLQPEAAEHVSAEYHHLQQVVEVLRTTHDYVLVDLDKRLDDHTLDVVSSADTIFMVMTADLACLKNMRLLLGTFQQIGVPEERVQPVLNRSNAHTGVSVEAAERVLPQRIRHMVPNDYRTAIGSLNSGTPFMVNKADSVIGKSVTKLARSLGAPEPVAHPAPRVGSLATALR
jgi:pilus assembly protein CpaE